MALADGRRLFERERDAQQVRQTRASSGRLPADDPLTPRSDHQVAADEWRARARRRAAGRPEGRP